MAQRRMIDKNIIISEKVSRMSVEGQLLFERMIVAADDFSLLPYSARKIKVLCVPFIDSITFGLTEKLLDLMASQTVGVINIFEYAGEKFYHIKKDKQTLKKDRKPQTLLPGIQNWDEIGKELEKLDTTGFQTEPIGIPLEEEEKRSEEKGREVKRSEAKLKKERECEREETIKPPSSASHSNGFDLLKQRVKELRESRAGYINNYLIVFLGFLLALFLVGCINRHTSHARTVASDSRRKTHSIKEKRPVPSVTYVPALIIPGIIINKIHGLESTWGRATTGLNIYCRNKGMWNEYGYDSPEQYCFKSKAEADETLRIRFSKEMDSGWLIPEMFCYYNTGIRLHDCGYYQRSLLIN